MPIEKKGFLDLQTKGLNELKVGVKYVLKKEKIGWTNAKQC